MTIPRHLYALPRLQSMLIKGHDPCTRRRIFLVPLVPRPPSYSKFVNMAIVLPQLGPWAESHIETITQATTQESFNEAFDAFVTKDESHLEITFNGVSVTRDEYKARLKGEAFDEAGASVQYNGIATVPGKDGNVTSNVSPPTCLSHPF